MVHLTRLDGTHFVLNADLVERIESTPDTVVFLTTGHHFVVREGVDAIVDEIIRFRRRIAQPGYLREVGA